MPREVPIAPFAAPQAKFDTHASSDSESSPAPKRAYGNKHRNKVLVISDSDSDSDLPPPSSLLRPTGRKPVVPSPQRKQQPRLPDEIIDISSDSEVEPTPTRPRAPPPVKRNTLNVTLPAVPSICSVSTSLSRTLDLINLIDTPSAVKQPDSKPTKSSPAITAPRDEEPNSSDVSDSENVDIFDEESYQPGLISDASSRRPKLIPSGSSTSVSTVPTPVSSQSSCTNDDPFDDVSNPTSTRPAAKTGNAKATSSGSGLRGRAKGGNDDSVAPETPQVRPRPKARAAIVSALSAPVTISPKPTPRNRAKVLAAQALALFSELNESVFDNRLPKDCEIIWSKKLNTTAGRAHWKRHRDSEGRVIRHESYIEFSTKVVDCEERINNTLSHEMCHLAAWIFDGETDKPHGPKFKHWGNRVMKARKDISITTCHSYEISYKYEWKCTTEECGRTFGRHSKSIDPAKQVCGCGGRLIALFAATPRRNAFQDYLKKHMKKFKEDNPDMPHGEVMKRLGEKFRAEKEAAVDTELDQVMAGMTKLKLGAGTTLSD